MCDQIMELPDTKFQILAPVVRGKRYHRKLPIKSLLKFVRIRINGEVQELSDSIELDKPNPHH